QAVILEEVMFPNDLSIFGVQTIKVAHRAEREHAAPGNQGRCPRPCGITNTIRTIVGVLPDIAATIGIETQDTLVARGGGNGTVARATSVSCVSMPIVAAISGSTPTI